jgi:DHA1 family bicyclomycin/chloramphenicol resistance-like MFS transporter
MPAVSRHAFLRKELMRLRPNTFAMTVVLALMTGMGPIATDLYVPSLPNLAEDLQTTPAKVQWTMSAYLIGFAVGQLFYGPLSDKFGRKPILLIGFSIFLAATIASGLSTSIEMLTLARSLQGLGGACPQILSRAMVRDMYEGHQAGRQLSIMSTIMGLAPILSPLGGGLLAIFFGWRAAFVVMFVIVSTLTLIAAVMLPETIRHRMEGPISPRSIFASFSVVARSRVWLVYSTVLACCHIGLFTFISTSPFVLRNIYGLNPLEFGIGFSICSTAFVMGAALGSRLVSRRGIDGTIEIGVTMLAAAGILQAVGLYLMPTNVLALFVPEILFFGGIGLVLPNSVAGALSPFPERAGAASSLAGFVQMLFSAAIGLVVVALLRDNAWPLVTITFSTGILAFGLFMLTRDLRNPR